MYHRISNREIDPWELSVKPENFDEQMQVLSQFNLIRIDELPNQIERKKITRESIVVTFDDGYLDNYTNAKPVLEKYKIPATFFITSINIGKASEFWWDELAQIILTTKKLPNTFHLNWNNQFIDFELKDEADLTDACYEIHKIYSIYQSSPTLRTQLYYLLWEFMTPLKKFDQEKILQIIRSWAHLEESKRFNFSCMSGDQIAKLANVDLFSIGGHTSTHPSLSFHDNVFQETEIKENKYFLENLIGTPVDFFAYPSGNFNEDSIAAVKNAGYKAAVTTNHKPVTSSVNPYTMGRFQINNWDGKTFERKIKNWLKH